MTNKSKAENILSAYYEDMKIRCERHQTRMKQLKEVSDENERKIALVKSLPWYKRYFAENCLREEIITSYERLRALD